MATATIIRTIGRIVYILPDMSEEREVKHRPSFVPIHRRYKHDWDGKETEYVVTNHFNKTKTVKELAIHSERSIFAIYKRLSLFDTVSKQYGYTYKSVKDWNEVFEHMKLEISKSIERMIIKIPENET